MDYKTKPTSRNDLRKYAKVIRKLFAIPPGGAFPVLLILDRIEEVFDNCNYVVVEDDKMPPQTMARCVQNELNGYTIEIKESVYEGAYYKQIGAFLGFICHEICHIFLFFIGFRPIYERSFSNNQLPAYCSVEWQAKALCAEVMLPFEETNDMSMKALIDKYHVSKGFAEARLKLGRR